MRIILSGILVFLLWTGLSSWFYVCQVKGLCTDAMEAGAYPVQEPGSNALSIAADSSARTIPEAPATLVIHFDTDQWAFLPGPDIKSRCEQFKTWAGTNPQAVLFVTGHTDATGPSDYNMTLGKRRAEAIRDYLTSIGVPAGRIVVASMGEEKPVEDNSNPDGRMMNRRAELSLNQN
ncbi:MAG TPA: OmpA family protein [Bacteroidales bacterium]|nr:OmpA family protein [Bacteroidales bacterium]